MCGEPSSSISRRDTTLKKGKEIKIVLFVNFNIHVIFE